MAITIMPGLTLPDEDVRFMASRGGGPGGQHVNTTSTRVQLEFDLEASRALDDEQKELVRRRIGNRLTRDGRLIVAAAGERSQLANREDAERKLAELLRWALRPEPKPRRATKPSRAARQRRLATKKHRATLKAGRKAPDAE